MHIATGHIDAAGQRVQNGMSTGGLGCIAVHLEPTPGEIRQWPVVPKQVRCFPYGAGIDPGDLRRDLGRDSAA